MCLNTISNSMIPKFICAFDWNICKCSIDILLDFKKAQARTILFFCLLQRGTSIPRSCLFTIAVTWRPIFPNAIIACIFIIARAIFDFIRSNGRNIIEFQLAMNRMFLIYCLDLIESKCSIFKFNSWTCFLNQGTTIWSDKNLISYSILQVVFGSLPKTETSN